MENTNIYAQKALEQLKARQELISNFTKDNPAPKAEYCEKHPEEVVTNYEARYIEAKDKVEWVKSSFMCELCEKEEVRKQSIRELMGYANIPLRYSEVKASEEYRKIIDNDKGILFIGGVGTGKTHQLVALMKNLIQNEKRVKFRTFGEICRQIRDAVGDNTYTELYNKYLSADVFVIDDLGIENSTPFIKEFIYNLVNDLYNNRKVVLITTNLSSAELLGNYTQRVVSRLNEMCEVVKLDGNDRRNKK